MSAPIPLRQDFEASQLRGLARRSKDGPQDVSGSASFGIWAPRKIALASDRGQPKSERP